MTPIRHDVEQRSPEWYALRLGKLTGSCAADAMGRLKNGNENAARRDLRMRLVCERLTGKSQESDYQSEDMKRGIEIEPVARAAYELATGHIVQTVGFLEHPEMQMGCSLDGYVGRLDNRLVSFKCPKTATHLRYLDENRVPPDYEPQMWHELALTDARYYDFVSFDDRLPAALQLVIISVDRTDLRVDLYWTEALCFLQECSNAEYKLRTLAERRAVA